MPDAAIEGVGFLPLFSGDPDFNLFPEISYPNVLSLPFLSSCR